MWKRWRYRLEGQLLKGVFASSLQLKANTFTEYSNHWPLKTEVPISFWKTNACSMHTVRTADGAVKSMHNATEWHRPRAQHDRRGGQWPTKSWTQKTDLRRSGQQEHYKGASINGSTGLGLGKCSMLPAIHGLKLTLPVEMLTVYDAEAYLGNMTKGALV